MPLLSVIVPVYKAEHFIKECIESIMNQTIKDFELILVDDGSPDQSGLICDSFASEDSRITVIHQTNHGVSHARNAGIAAAKGDYIAFVDADDWIEPDMYEKLFCEIEKNPDLDVVACNRYLDENTIPNYHPYTEYISKDTILTDLFSKPSFMMASSCNKIIRSDIVKKHRYKEEIRMWEDLVFLTEIYLSDCTSAVYIPDYLYHYRTNENSATNNSLPYIGNDVFKKYVFTPLKAYSHSIAGTALDYYLDTSLQLLRMYKKIDIIQKDKIIRSIRKTILFWTVYGKAASFLNRQKFHRYLIEGVFR